MGFQDGRSNGTAPQMSAAAKRAMDSSAEQPVDVNKIPISGPVWAIAYGASSLAITLFNKAVLSSFEFHYSAFLTLCQGICTLVSMLILRKLGIINFPGFSREIATKIFPLSVVSLFYIIVSLSALSGINLPMFTALRRTTILFTMALEFFMMGTTPSRKIRNSVIVMVGGALIAAAKDLTFDPYSYFLLFLTNFATASYTVKIAQVKKSTPGLNVFTMLYYNTLLTLPLVFALTYVNGEFSKAARNPFIHHLPFQISFLMSCMLAFVMNLCTYFSSSLNGPTTQSVVGQLKNFLALLLSLMLFDDYVFHPVNFAGLTVGFLGGLWYAKIKLDEGKQKTETSPRQDPESTPLKQSQ